jgi:alkylresorcinol/alkylpyrone synthase
VHIAAVGHAFPEHYYEQEDLLRAFLAFWGKRHFNLDRLARLHRNVLVGGRHLALTLPEYEALEGFGDANRAWIRVAQEVGGRAVSTAIEASGIAIEDIGAFFTVTVTGICTPALGARLMNRLSLPTHIKRIPIFGLGCVAGAAGIARAADYVKAFPTQAALLLSVELCSLTLQREDLSIPNLISTGLFGDGAACVVVVGDQHPVAKRSKGPRVIATRSVFYPDTERVMGWDISEKGFQVVLSAAVPSMVRDHLRRDVDILLTEQNLRITDIESWVCHPGGPKVLEAFAAALDIDRSALQVTWDHLANVGNLSSTSVLMVLEDTIRDHRPPPGAKGMILAMGPAFCSELVLVEW